MTLLNSTAPTSILRRKQVQARTGLSRSSLYALAQQGKFPKPIALSERSVGWVESEIDQWITQRIERSRQAVL